MPETLVFICFLLALVCFLVGAFSSTTLNGRVASWVALGLVFWVAVGLWNAAEAL